MIKVLKYGVAIFNQSKLYLAIPLLSSQSRPSDWASMFQVDKIKLSKYGIIKNAFKICKSLELSGALPLMKITIFLLLIQMELSELSPQMNPERQKLMLRKCLTNKF